jgi:hypothetical protein
MATNRLTQVNTEAVVSNNANVQLTQVSTEIVCSVSYGLVKIFSGNFQDCQGNPIANGYLNVRLISDSHETFTGNGEIYSGRKLAFPLDMTGNVPLTPAYYLWSNATLSPSGSFYEFQLYDATGIQLWISPLTGVIPDQSSYNLAGLLRS